MLRIADRVPGHGQISLSTQQRGWMADLSTSGVRVRTGVRLDVGSEVGIRLQLPDGSGQINCRCRVAWCKACDGDGDGEGHVVGLEFISMAESDRQRLGEALQPPPPTSDANEPQHATALGPSHFDLTV